ncbi:AEC family transporter [Paracoccus suum]|uniref:AEC family transporter n=1 Tax=Paracoccus suum TaxID=2259340 RepID=A0A344PG42_9RHOB|nr:AEC family transporter [Paracoccus suum]AXC48347.1 AEC family transporter [Paracoccus suum]
MAGLFSVVLPVFLVLGFGYLVAWRGWMGADAVDAVMRFAQNFALPVLVFQSMARLDIGHGFDLALLAAFYAGAFVSFFAGWAGGRWLFRRSPEDCVAIGFICLFSNSLLLGLPLTERAYGPDSLAGNYAIIAIHSPLMYTFGITFMEFTRARGMRLSVSRVAWRALSGVLRTPLVMGIIAGLAVNLLIQAGLVLPQGVWDAAAMMARAAIPAALFGLGGVLVRYRPAGDAGAIAMCCLCVLVLHPAVTYGLGRTFGLDAPAMRSAVVTAAMPPGVNAYLFAAMYGSAQRVAASTVLIATLAAVLTAWAWLSILP